MLMLLFFKKIFYVALLMEAILMFHLGSLTTIINIIIIFINVNIRQEWYPSLPRCCIRTKNPFQSHGTSSATNSAVADLGQRIQLDHPSYPPKPPMLYLLLVPRSCHIIFNRLILTITLLNGP